MRTIIPALFAIAAWLLVFSAAAILGADFDCESSNTPSPIACGRSE
jgi:hypothetical protein